MSTIERSNPSSISRRDFLKGIAAGAVAAAVVAVGIEEYRIAGIPGPTETVTTTAPGVTATTTTTTTVPGPTTTVTTTPGITPPPVEELYEKTITLTVNNRKYTLDVQSQWPLAYVLREKLQLTGTKVPCNRGECGGCTVMLDGKPVLSCMTLAIEAEDKDILTIEGLSDGLVLHPIQQAFVDHDGLQCGFCTPSVIMMAKDLLDRNKSPTEQQVREALAGVVCKCGVYDTMVESVLAAAEVM